MISETSSAFSFNSLNSSNNLDPFLGATFLPGDVVVFFFTGDLEDSLAGDASFLAAAFLPGDVVVFFLSLVTWKLSSSDASFLAAVFYLEMYLSFFFVTGDLEASLAGDASFLAAVFLPEM